MWFIKYTWSNILNFTCEYVYYTFIIMKLSYNSQVPAMLVNNIETHKTF